MNERELKPLATAVALQYDGERAPRVAAKGQLSDVFALSTDILLEEKRLQEARESAEKSLEFAAETEDPELLAASYRCLGAVHRACGDLEQAKAALGKAWKEGKA